MFIDNINRILKIAVNTKTGINLHTGDYVYVKVIKKLTSNKWAVSIKGNLIPAYSQLELTEGDIMHARVENLGQKIALRITDQTQNQLQDLMKQAGIEFNDINQLIVAALLKSGMNIENYIVKIIRHIISKIKKGEYRRIVRLLSILLNKNIPIDFSELEPLLELLDFGEKKRESKEKYKKKRYNSDSKHIKEIVKKSVTKLTEDNILQLVNHIKAKNENWLFIPYDCVLNELQIKGTIRLLYEPFDKKIKKYVIIAYVNNNIRWSFQINDRNGSWLLSIFCNNKEAIIKAKKHLNKLGLKLENFGVIIDDTIHEDINFDGFSTIETGKYYKKIDIIS